ncbi:MAG: hypothetical protein IPJ69_03595 [Deltaproteobacteria bacterium]|nr:MAG: hypothetical protein IPJ69_03595 [Deltaproteobacteria bacterium]
MTKLPSFQFYPGDWLKDPSLRSVSYAARGLWTDMLCLMHESDRRGYLQLNGKPVSLEQLARMTGGSTDEVSHLLQELKDSGVFSCTEHGMIYSRRFVRDEKKRQLCAEAGKRGGNPMLLKNNDIPMTLKGHFKGEVKGEAKGPPNPEITPSSSLSSSTSKQPPLPPEGEVWFEKFWKEYPNQVSRGEAEKIWKNMKVTEEIFPEIMTGLLRAKKSAQWLKESGQYIPHAARWLKSKGWQDVYPKTIVNERGITVLNPVYQEELSPMSSLISSLKISDQYCPSQSSHEQ